MLKLLQRPPSSSLASSRPSLSSSVPTVSNLPVVQMTTSPGSETSNRK